MAFWSKKKLFDVLKKELKNDNISASDENSKLSFEISFKDAKFNLYPYIKLDEEESIMTIEVNIRKVEKENLYEKINSFNLKSKYFALKLNDGILYLEYNVKVTTDNVYSLCKACINSLDELQFEIDKL